MRFPLLALVLGLLCACSSPSSSTPPAPPSDPGPDAATVVVFRDRCPPILIKGTVQIDGVKHATLGVENYTAVRIAPGRYELKYAYPLWAAMPSKKLVIEAEPKTTHYYLYTTTMGFFGTSPMITPQLSEISEARGKQLMAEFKAVRSDLP